VSALAATITDKSTLTPEDLADLFASFQTAADALQQTHTRLQGEVARLEDELRQTRRQLHRAQELAALGEMAAGIAHEIRNPLGSIKLYASALSDDLGDRPEQRDLAGKVVRGVDRLNAIVGDVLAFSRELRVGAEPIPAPALVAEAAEACRACLEHAGAALEVAGVEGRVVCADPTLLHQALVNVLRNACEAVSSVGTGGGRIRVALGDRHVRDAEGRRTPMASLTVADTGPGFPEAIADRLFNPFFTTREAGSGLGLAIVHRILDAHGGRVQISNNRPPERGATVELLLPEPTPATSNGETP
jgi:two-component system sensor histidine kinase HydH